MTSPGILREHCFLMTGWIRRFAIMTGGTDVVVKKDSCVHHVAPFCEWSGRWN